MANTKYDDDGNVIEVPENLEKARQAAFEQIRKKAILIDLKRRQFSNMPFDQDATDLCTKAIGANDQQLQVRKFLIKPEYLSTIRNIMNDAGLLVVNHTRPWENVGPRVLPMEFYDDFTEAFGQCVDEFEAELDKLIQNWDSYVKEAKKNLGSAFKKTDYPTKDQLRDIFHLSIETSEFPNIEDIRLGLGGAELLEMQNEVSEKYTDALHEAFDEAMKGIEKASTKTEATMFYNIASTLNVAGNAELEMKLTEALDNHGDMISLDSDDESMMVMDDIDMDCIEDDDDDEGEVIAECSLKTPQEAFTDTDEEPESDIDFDNLI
jgi:hypothetical protein